MPKTRHGTTGRPAVLSLATGRGSSALAPCGEGSFRRWRFSLSKVLLQILLGGGTSRERGERGGPREEGGKLMWRRQAQQVCRAGLGSERAGQRAIATSVAAGQGGAVGGKGADERL